MAASPMIAGPDVEDVVKEAEERIRRRKHIIISELPNMSRTVLRRRGKRISWEL